MILMSTHRITRRHLLIAALTLAPVAGILLPNSVLAAQATRAPAVAEPVSPDVPSERARAHLARGFELSTSGNYAAAGTEFARAARLQRANAEVPFEALWMRAQMYNVRGFPAQAASALSQLAGAAAAAGNPALEARALLEAAVLYQHAHMPEQMHRRLAELDRILASGRLDQELQRAIEGRIFRA
jgi:hypothetical protein